MPVVKEKQRKNSHKHTDDRVISCLAQKRTNPPHGTEQFVH